MSESAAPTPGPRSGEDTRTAVTVLVALGANLVIALAKAIGGVFTGSPALLTMRLGTESTLVAARIDLVAGLDSEEVEEILMRVKAKMTAVWPHADQIFLDVTDASAKDRARARQDLQALDRAVAADAGADAEGGST